MGYYKAVFNFNRPIEEKAPEERDIHTKMSNNTLFDHPPIDYSHFFTAIEEQTLAVDNAQNGGRSQIALMRTKERAVDDILRKYRDYVTNVADGDTDIILSSGFMHTKPRSSSGDMPMVTGVKNLKSEISGGLKLRWKPVKNVSFYEVDVRLVVATNQQPLPIPSPTDGGDEGDTPAPSSTVVERPWNTTASKPARIEKTGLKPLSQYEVRVRAKGTKSYGGYSDVVIMVVT